MQTEPQTPISRLLARTEHSPNAIALVAGDERWRCGRLAPHARFVVGLDMEQDGVQPWADLLNVLALVLEWLSFAISRLVRVRGRTFGCGYAALGTMQASLNQAFVQLCACPNSTLRRPGLGRAMRGFRSIDHRRLQQLLPDQESERTAAALVQSSFPVSHWCKAKFGAGLP